MNNNSYDTKESSYEDILFMEHPTSKKHTPMAIIDRAAQFSPFAALTGFGDLITETEEVPDERPELDPDRLRELNEILSALITDRSRPKIELTYFVPNKNNGYGHIATRICTLRKYLPERQILLLDDHTELPIEDILDVTVEVNQTNETPL